MKAKKRCDSCCGSGKVMGAGMIMIECETCDGLGKIFLVDEIDYLEKTDSYKKAIEEIKTLDPNMSDEKAKEIFEDELKKIADEKKERKSKRK